MIPLYVVTATEQGKPLMKKYLNNPDEIAEDKILRRAFSGSVIKNIDPDKRQIEFIISTACIDRMGDIIEVPGWDLKNYKTNPVVLFGHMSSIPPIGKAIKVWKDADALRAIAEFIPQDISAFAHSIFRMYEEKFLHAVSVGFRPLKWERLVDEEGNETWSFRFKKQELLEFSAVPIPANPEALVAARQKGIDTAPFKSFAEEMLDRWNETGDPLKDIYGVDKKFMENVRRRAAGSGTTYQVPPDVQDEIMKRNLEAIRKAKAAKAKTKLTVRGLEIELPKFDPTKMKIGELIFSNDEINGKKSLHIDRADESILFTKELVDDLEMDFLSLEIRDTEGEEKDIILTVKADNGVLEYTVLGYNETDTTLYGLKSKDFEDLAEAMAEAEVVDLTGDDDEETKSDDDEDEVEKSSDDDDDDDDDDEEDKPKKGKKPKGDEEEDDDEKSGKVETKSDDDDDLTMDFPTHMIFVEEALVGFEEALDNLGEKAHTRREQRRLEFLGGFMRDLADRLDGGKGRKSGNTTLTIKGEEKEDAFTPAEAQAYLKSVTEQLSPLLTEMIQSKISKLRGRLD